MGNTVAITDGSETVVNSYDYSPFGMIISLNETFSQPFKFVGKLGVMAESNGFYYMRARYYDPVIGRFISEDPLGFDGGDVNLYVYGGNNPLLVVDPSGLWTLQVGLSGSGGAGRGAQVGYSVNPNPAVSVTFGQEFTINEGAAPSSTYSLGLGAGTPVETHGYLTNTTVNQWGGGQGGSGK